MCDVAPMTSVATAELYQRKDVVNDGNKVDDILANAPESDDNYFVVPKVVE